MEASFPDDTFYLSSKTYCKTPAPLRILNCTFSNLSSKSGKPMKTICFFNHEFSLLFKTRKTYKHQLIFNDFVFTKNHLENPYDFFAPRISIFDRSATFLSYVCNGFHNFFLAEIFALMYPARSTRVINSPNFILGPRTKHTVKPHCR